MTKNDFLGRQYWASIFPLFSIGIIFAIFILALALALILRERIFISYAIFLSFAQLFIYTSTGLSRMLVNLFGRWYIFFGFGTLYLALRFVNTFLNIRKHLPSSQISCKAISGLCMTPWDEISDCSFPEYKIYLEYRTHRHGSTRRRKLHDV